MGVGVGSSVSKVDRPKIVVSVVFLHRTESVRGPTCPREKSLSRGPRASMSLPKPRESVRRERCSEAPSDRCSHRESRSQPRGTEVTQV